ncbi:MAG: sterol desaturase family protein [Deltaproteobacteria bacterium]|nr:MAG: sterol desaturase family protein [Deltaproteobacteria bacterium]
MGLAFALVEFLRGRMAHTREQLTFDLVTGGTVGFVVSPLVAVGASLLLDLVLPASRDAWADLPVWAAVLLFLVGDDLVHYAWHRLSHSVPLLYTLHRAHHSAPYMSVSMMYRNNLFYYACMPSLWVSGALVHLGLGSVYAVYLVVKLTVIAGAHSSVRWDEPLYRIPALHPVMWVVERVISTPSTHAMHHGQHADDGVTHYKGNYGNLLFVWDMIFGTGRITRRYPEAYGIEGLADQSFATEFAWPLVPLAPDED